MLPFNEVLPPLPPLLFSISGGPQAAAARGSTCCLSMKYYLLFLPSFSQSQEDRKLLLHVAAHGTRQWRAVVNAGLLPGRDSKACCNRFIVLRRKYFDFQERFQEMEMEMETPEIPLPLQKAATTQGSEIDNRSAEDVLADLSQKNNTIVTTAHAAAPGFDYDSVSFEFAAPAPVIEVSASEYAAMEYGSPGSSSGSVAAAAPATVENTDASAAAVGNPAAAAAAAAATEAATLNLLLARPHESAHEATGVQTGALPMELSAWSAAAAAAACAARDAGMIDLLLASPHEPAHEATGVDSGALPLELFAWSAAAAAAVPAPAPAAPASAAPVPAAAASTPAVAARLERGSAVQSEARMLNVTPRPTLQGDARGRQQIHARSR
ncbi:unnamed protein product [Closterium sp. Naga37s-1]|nr:unnamed protein product [Closterium sp. Naga37s-1]